MVVIARNVSLCGSLNGVKDFLFAVCLENETALAITPLVISDLAIMGPAIPDGHTILDRTVC